MARIGGPPMVHAVMSGDVLDSAAFEVLTRLNHAHRFRDVLEALETLRIPDAEATIRMHRSRSFAYEGLGDVPAAMREAIRGLLLTGQHKGQRQEARLRVADTFIRAGQLGKAERMTHRALSEIRAGHERHRKESAQILIIARVHHRTARHR